MHICRHTNVWTDIKLRLVNTYNTSSDLLRVNLYVIYSDWTEYTARFTSYITEEYTHKIKIILLKSSDALVLDWNLLGAKRGPGDERCPGAEPR